MRCNLPAILAFLTGAVGLSGCILGTGANSAATLQPVLPSTADWGLEGTLVYTATAAKDAQLVFSVRGFGLEDRRERTIFEAQPGAWLDAAAVASEHQAIIIAYAPRPAVLMEGQQALYVIPLDGSRAPELLFPPPSAEDQYNQPHWSPDGQFVYFTHWNRQALSPPEIMRMRYPDGKPEQVAADAMWPRLSQDGSRLAYVRIDPENGSNRLFTAEPDGTDAQPVPMSGLPASAVIDAPMFSPDMQTILFSGSAAMPASSLNWTEKLLGITVARANGNIPSDWWSVPTEGGSPTQLTNIQTLALYGWYSPDNEQIASYSADGIFVMKPDGTGVTLVVPVRGSMGTVEWLP